MDNKDDEEDNNSVSIIECEPIWTIMIVAEITLKEVKDRIEITIDHQHLLLSTLIRILLHFSCFNQHYQS